MQRKSKYERKHSSSKIAKSNISQKEELPKCPRNRSSFKFKEIKESIDQISSNFEKAYTSTCKVFFPLIIKPTFNKMNKTQKYCIRFPFYCFTCHTHFFYDDKSTHQSHSFINLIKVEITEDVIINAKKDLKRAVNQLVEAKQGYFWKNE